MADVPLEIALPRLTPAEMATLRAVADGLTYAEIAAQSHRDPLTVKARMAVVRGKLQAKTTAGAIAQGFRIGLLT